MMRATTIHLRIERAAAQQGRIKMKRIRPLFFGKMPLAGVLVLAALASLGASPARAQEPAKVDIFGGYSYMYGNVVVTGQGINLNGGGGSFAYNYNKWLGLVFDLTTNYQGNVASTGRTLMVTTYLFGPRISWRKNEKLTPFGQALFGGGHGGGTLYTAGPSPLGTQNAFAMTLGGGVDWKVHPSISVRLFDAEYLRTQFANGVNTSQNNFRLSTGVVFHFGRR
jgi:opacity protein-like surface antigen